LQQDHFAEGYVTSNSFLAREQAPAVAEQVAVDLPTSPKPSSTNIGAGTITSRKVQEEAVAIQVGVDVDDSEHKYAKRPVAERMARVVSNQIGTNSGAEEPVDDGLNGLKKMALIAIVIIFVAVTILETLSRAKDQRRESIATV
jgi:hypothetical protein